MLRWARIRGWKVRIRQQLPVAVGFHGNQVLGGVSGPWIPKNSSLKNPEAQALDPEKHRMLVSVHVDEGEQYRTGDISIVSDQSARPSWRFPNRNRGNKSSFRKEICITLLKSETDSLE